MARLRPAIGATAAALLLLAVGCAGAPAVAPSPTPAPRPAISLSPVPTQASTIPLAKIKSVTQAKPITPNPASGPRLALDADMADFGDVPYGTIVAYSFTVKNVGSALVVLGPAFIRVKDGC